MRRMNLCRVKWATEKTEISSDPVWDRTQTSHVHHPSTAPRVAGFCWNPSQLSLGEGEVTAWLCQVTTLTCSASLEFPMHLIVHIFELWEEARDNPHRHRGNMQTILTEWSHGLEPVTFSLLWGNSANHCAAMSPSSEATTKTISLPANSMVMRKNDLVSCRSLDFCRFNPPESTQKYLYYSGAKWGELTSCKQTKP